MRSKRKLYREGCDVHKSGFYLLELFELWQ